MKARLILTAVALCALAGCATKNYGRVTDVTGFERSTMTCREIDLEMARTQGFIERVKTESGKTDAAAVMGFLLDWGVGNAMERRAAIDSATARMSELQTARTDKNCVLSTAHAE